MAETNNAASQNESPLQPGDVIPIVAMRNVALLPGVVVPITLGREESLAAALEAVRSG
jgi:ATP-dependent Lon protease